mgnify:CR=1 FL=1
MEHTSVYQNGSVQRQWERNLANGISYNIYLDNHHNLVSFYALPHDTTLSVMTSSLIGNIFSVITEGSSAAYDSQWIGSLTEFYPEKGYWISIKSPLDTLSGLGVDYNPNRVYNLHPGPNLISFPDTGSVDIETAIHDSVKNHFSVVISEGVCAINTDEFGWIGTLNQLYPGGAYWVISGQGPGLAWKQGVNRRGIARPYRAGGWYRSESGRNLYVLPALCGTGR